ncbi:MAG: hypothetical protein M3457_04440, partial [Chloroflexota bacterium]|nr:hypothetical protein [Chloroflexota bacterium]
MSEVGTAGRDEELNQLQRMLLTAVLQGEPLPGGSHPVELPDLAFVQKDGVVRVSTENVAGSLTIEAGPLPIRVLSPESLREEACARGDVTYLAFQPAAREEARIRLTIEGRIATCDPGRHPLGLS